MASSSAASLSSLRVLPYPSIEELKQGVRDAMSALIWLRREYSDRAVLPRDIQGDANALVVGVIYCNGFGGRCREWSILTKEHFLNQMRRHRDFVVCSTHKTSLIYGDLAKWLAPGTIQAMLEYLKLPRRDDVETFLHPVATDTAFVDVHHALKVFAVKMMPAQRRCLTANLLRRWYHTRLALEQPVLEELARLGTNTGADAVRDSILRDPLDDVLLAKILIEDVIPSQAVIPRGFDPTLCDTDVASEDEELEWFHGAERYGIPEPHSPSRLWLTSRHTRRRWRPRKCSYQSKASFQPHHRRRTRRCVTLQHCYRRFQCEIQGPKRKSHRCSRGQPMSR